MSLSSKTKKIILISFLSKAMLLIFLLLFVIGCKNVSKIESTIPPVANAGAAQSVKEKNIVTLAGGGVDSDGSVISYHWQQTMGTPVVLNDANVAQPTFSAPSIAEVLMFEITVTDNDGLTHSAATSVTVILNELPVVNAGLDQTVREADAVTLNGAATDSDGNIVSYVWTQIAGTEITAAEIISGDFNSTTFTFSAPALAETLTFQLATTDDFGATHEDIVNVIITLNQPPVAKAGSDQTVLESDTVQLSGVESTDDGSIQNFNWVQMTGSVVSLVNNNSATSSFVAPNISETLTFQLTVTDEHSVSHLDTVDIIVNYIYQPVLSISNTLYVKTDSINEKVYDDCSTFEPNYFNFSIAPDYNELNVGPIALIWGNDHTYVDADTSTLLTKLNSNTAEKQNLFDNTEEMLRRLTEDYKLDLSPAHSLVDGKCYRVNVYFRGAVAWANDTNPGGGGGARCTGDGGLSIPANEIPMGNIVYMSEAPNRIASTMAHEYWHAIQCRANKLNAGWEWYVESTAGYFAAHDDSYNIFLNDLQMESFLSIDNYASRYAAIPFWLFTEHEFGKVFMGDVLQRVSTENESLIEYIYRTAPVDCANGDTACRDEAFGNFFGRFAAYSVNYVATTEMINNTYSQTDRFQRRHRKSAQLQKIDEKKYRITDWLAPQRFGHNHIELIPDPSNRLLTIKLDGWEISERNAQWRATVVATLDNSTVPRTEAWGEIFKSGTQVIDLDQWEASLGATIKKLHLAVSAVPVKWKLESEITAGYDDASRHDELDSYVYELTINGAWPLGHEPENFREALVVAGENHNNGGGFVANTATVAPTVYVGPNARVLDNAQVLGNARIEGRAIIRDNAIVQDNAIVSSSVEMYDNAKAEGFATIRDNILMYDNARVIGEGKLMGDTNAYGTFLISGQAANIGATRIWTTSNLTLSGTAIINGHKWFNDTAYTMGTPYDNWTVNDNGLFYHYDLTEAHPYRIKDIHVSSDAYFFNVDGSPGDSSAGPTFLNDVTLNSQVIELAGDSYLTLPKLTFDFHQSQLEMMLKWQGAAEESLIDVASERGEHLAVKLIPNGNDKFDVKLTFVDRNAETQEILLQNNIFLKNQWIKLAMNFDGSTSTMKLIAVPFSGTPVVEASAILPTPTREFDYDTLTIRLGANSTGGQGLNALIDDIKLIRQ